MNFTAKIDHVFKGVEYEVTLEAELYPAEPDVGYMRPYVGEYGIVSIESHETGEFSNDLFLADDIEYIEQTLYNEAEKQHYED